MKPYKINSTTAACIITVLLLALCSCTVSPRLPDEQSSDRQLTQIIDRLTAEITTASMGVTEALAPVVIIPGSAMRGERYSHLEELLVKNIAIRLAERRTVYHLTGQNWFQFREKRPLTLSRGISGLMIYEVNLLPEIMLKHLNINITAYDDKLHSLPGRGAELTIPFTAEDLAGRLYNAPPTTNPFPRGLEENPYQSLDRLTFKLAGMLHDTYIANSPATIDNLTAANNEVNVLLYVPAVPRLEKPFLSRLNSSLQQAIVAQAAFTCAMGNQDMPAFFQRVKFYQQHGKIFNFVSTPLSAGSIMLLADVIPVNDQTVGIMMRAVWRISPLEDINGNLITYNTAGTYLSGFTAKAFLRLPREDNDIIPRGREEEKMAVCFTNFPPRLELQAARLLHKFPSGTITARRGVKCPDREGPCHCFTIEPGGQELELAAWLRDKLPRTQIFPFSITNSKGRTDVVFNNGFN